MTIHTPQSLRRTQRRLDHRNATKQRRERAKTKVLAAMRGGASLHRCNRQHRIVWALSTGEFVTAEAAIDARSDAHVVGVGDCLFGPWSELSQTFRYVDEQCGLSHRGSSCWNYGRCPAPMQFEN